MVKLKIGVIGAGAIALESHFPALRKMKDIETVAVCDQQIEAAERAARRFGIGRVFGDASKMLSEVEPDAVDICTPPAAHAPLSIQAMEAGCAVLVEKPMATSLKEADEMIDSSRKNGAKLCVLHQNVCNPVVIEARRLVEAGAVGQLLNVAAGMYERTSSEVCTNPNHWSHKLPGGLFYELLPHPIYLTQQFLKGVRPTHVLARKLGDRDWMRNDELRVSLEGENGLGSIVASCNSEIHGDMLDILGSEMALRADLWGRTLITYRPRSDMSKFSVGMGNLHLSGQLLNVVGSTASSVLKVLWGKANAHYIFISRFIDSIMNNVAPPTTPEDGKETLRVLGLICQQLGPKT